MFEGITHVDATALHEAGGVGMAIDAAIVVEMVFESDVAGIAPVEDVVVNFRAIGMVADETFALVAFAIGECAAGNAGSEGVERLFRGFLPG